MRNYAVMLGKIESRTAPKRRATACLQHRRTVGSMHPLLNGMLSAFVACHPCDGIIEADGAEKVDAFNVIGRDSLSLRYLF
jgi:hypothetical protein